MTAASARPSEPSPLTGDPGPEPQAYQQNAPSSTGGTGSPSSGTPTGESGTPSGGGGGGGGFFNSPTGQTIIGIGAGLARNLIPGFAEAEISIWSGGAYATAAGYGSLPVVGSVVTTAASAPAAVTAIAFASGGVGYLVGDAVESVVTEHYGRTAGVVSGTGTGTGAGALAGAATGALLGAAIGSVVPGVGTAVGAIVGGIAGAIGGFIGAYW